MPLSPEELEALQRARKKGAAPAKKGPAAPSVPDIREAKNTRDAISLEVRARTLGYASGLTEEEAAELASPTMPGIVPETGRPDETPLSPTLGEVLRPKLISRTPQAQRKQFTRLGTPVKWDLLQKELDMTDEEVDRARRFYSEIMALNPDMPLEKVLQTAVTRTLIPEQFASKTAKWEPPKDVKESVLKEAFKRRKEGVEYPVLTPEEMATVRRRILKSVDEKAPDTPTVVVNTITGEIIPYDPTDYDVYHMVKHFKVMPREEAVKMVAEGMTPFWAIPGKVEELQGDLGVEFFGRSPQSGAHVESVPGWLMRLVLTPWNAAAGLISEVALPPKAKKKVEEQYPERYREHPVLRNIAFNEGFVGIGIKLAEAMGKEYAEELGLPESVVKGLLIGGSAAADFVVDVPIALASGTLKLGNKAVEMAAKTGKGLSAARKILQMPEGGARLRRFLQGMMAHLIPVAEVGKAYARAIYDAFTTVPKSKAEKFTELIDMAPNYEAAGMGARWIREMKDIHPQANARALYDFFAKFGGKESTRRIDLELKRLRGAEWMDEREKFNVIYDHVMSHFNAGSPGDVIQVAHDTFVRPEDLPKLYKTAENLKFNSETEKPLLKVINEILASGEPHVYTVMDRKVLKPKPTQKGKVGKPGAKVEEQPKTMMVGWKLTGEQVVALEKEAKEAFRQGYIPEVVFFAHGGQKFGPVFRIPDDGWFVPASRISSMLDALWKKAAVKSGVQIPMHRVRSVITRTEVTEPLETRTLGKRWYRNFMHTFWDPKSFVSPGQRAIYEEVSGRVRNLDQELRGFLREYKGDPLGGIHEWIVQNSSRADEGLAWAIRQNFRPERVQESMFDSLTGLIWKGTENWLTPTGEKLIDQIAQKYARMVYDDEIPWHQAVKHAILEAEEAFYANVPVVGNEPLVKGGWRVNSLIRGRSTHKPINQERLSELIVGSAYKSVAEEVAGQAIVRAIVRDPLSVYVSGVNAIHPDVAKRELYSLFILDSIKDKVPPLPSILERVLKPDKGLSTDEAKELAEYFGVKWEVAEAALKDGRIVGQLLLDKAKERKKLEKFLDAVDAYSEAVSAASKLDVDEIRHKMWTRLVQLSAHIRMGSNPLVKGSNLDSALEVLNRVAPESFTLSEIAVDEFLLQAGVPSGGVVADDLLRIQSEHLNELALGNARNYVGEAGGEGVVQAAANYFKRVDSPGVISKLGTLFYTANALRYTTLLGMRIRFHGVNFLTAPFLIYMSLGGKNIPGVHSGLLATRTMSAGLGFSRSVNTYHIAGQVFTDLDIYRMAVLGTGARSAAGAVIHEAIIRDSVRVAGAAGLTGKVGWLKDLAFAGNRLGDYTDQWWRLGVFWKSVMNGEPPLLAARKAREALFDYGKLSAFERATIARIAIFYTFTRMNVANFMRNLTSIEGLRKAGRLLKTQRAVNYIMTGGDRDKLAFLPEWAASRIILSIDEDADGEWYDVIMGPPIPFLDAFVLVGNLISLDPEPIRGLLNPAFAVPLGVQRTSFDKRVAPEHVLLLRKFGAWDLFQALMKAKTGAPVPGKYSPNDPAADDNGIVWWLNPKQEKFYHNIMNVQNFMGSALPIIEYTRMLSGEQPATYPLGATTRSHVKAPDPYEEQQQLRETIRGLGTDYERR